MTKNLQQDHEDRFWAISRSLFAEYEAFQAEMAADRKYELTINSRVSPEELEAVAEMLKDPSRHRGELEKKLRAIEAKIAKAQKENANSSGAARWNFTRNLKLGGLKAMYLF